MAFLDSGNHVGRGNVWIGPNLETSPVDGQRTFGTMESKPKPGWIPTGRLTHDERDGELPTVKDHVLGIGSFAIIAQGESTADRGYTAELVQTEVPIHDI